MFVRGIFLFDITFNKTFLLKVCMGKRKKKQQQQQTNKQTNNNKQTMNVCIQQLFQKAITQIDFVLFRYTGACSKLLVQYKAAFKQVHKDYPTVEDFMKKYRVCLLILVYLFGTNCISKLSLAAVKYKPE